MARIKIKDLPTDQVISQTELKNVFGGMQMIPVDLLSMGGLSEEDSLRLQIAMDRRAKTIQTLSNIIKKTSQTQDSIIQNIK